MVGVDTHQSLGGGRGRESGREGGRERNDVNLSVASFMVAISLLSFPGFSYAFLLVLRPKCTDCCCPRTSVALCENSY